jgi:DNA-binding NarL/FixJ family response regulator
MAGHRPGSPKRPPPVKGLPLDPKVWNEVASVMRLAPQEARIVGLILQGKRDKQIAKDLELGVPTVRTYLKRVFHKVEVQDRMELVLRVFAVAHGLSRGPRV